MHTSFFHRIARRDGRWRSSWKHASRDTNGQGIRRHIRENHCVGSNDHIIPDLNRPQNLGAGAYVNAVAENWRAALTGMLQTHCYSVANDAIVSKNGVATDDDSAEMVDSEPPS